MTKSFIHAKLLCLAILFCCANVFSGELLLKDGKLASKIKSGGELAEFEGVGAVIWKASNENQQFRLYKFDKDWSSGTSFTFKVYSKAATGQKIGLGIYSENEEMDGPDYYKYFFVVDWQGWKTVSIPYSGFRVTRNPVGWNSIDEVKFAANWGSKDIKPGTELIFTSVAFEKATEVAGLFSNNMVLQRNAAIPVWGKADAGTSITVKLTGKGINKSVAGTADKDGSWQVELPAMKAGGPYMLTINDSIKLENVWVGDVWLCSGQSNMGMQVYKVNNAEKEIASSANPNLRLFTVGRNMTTSPVTEFSGSWQEAMPETVKSFSAAAYFFGREINKETGVVIGLINSSWGGTQIEAWTSAPALSNNVKIKDAAVKMEQEIANFDNIKSKYKVWEDKWRELKKQNADDKEHKSHRPTKPHCIGSVLYNAMIYPIQKFPVKGVLWYQGESNSRNSEMYGELFKTMINDWRKQYNKPEMPFLFVQLANYMDKRDEPMADCSWAEVREGQRSALELSHTAMAVAIDVGEAKDIHPKNKQAVGHRLALAALATVYDKDIVYSGPVVKKVKFADKEVRIDFDSVGTGLAVKGDKPTGFELGDGKGNFVRANAKLEGNSVIISSDEIAKPTVVRYGWAFNPDSNLYNSEDLPASPFEVRK